MMNARTGILFFTGQLLFTNVVLSAEPEGFLEEILVTAQKRVQNIQKVGITLSAFSTEDIQKNSFVNLSDVASQVSNTEMFQDYGGGGLPTWVIRGVGLQDFNANNTPTAAVYSDEIYKTSNAMGSIGLFDIERIEVLKGPQGGLYGRNASGGAVNVITRSPELDNADGYMNLDVSSWQNVTLDGATNIPVSDTLALRVAGRRQFSRDAWQKSLVSGSHYGEKNNWNLRTKLLYKPNDRFDFQLKLHGGVDNSEIQLGRSVGLYAGPTTLCAAVLAGHRDESSCLDWGSINKVVFGGQPTLTSVQSDNGTEVLSDPINRHSNDFYGVLSTINMDLDFAHLVSLTAYDRFDYGVALDLDGASGEFGHRLSSSDMEAWSQEFRLSSDEDDPLSWMLGVSFGSDIFLENRDFLLKDNRLIGLVKGELNYKQTTRSNAVFAQLVWHPGDELSISGDIRYTDEDKKYRNGTFLAPAFPPPFNVVAEGLRSDYTLGSHLAGKIQINWQARDNTLIYGSLSRGFKSGGFYGGFPFEPEEVAPYSEEKILAYELGFKSILLDSSLILNAAAFYYDYKDVQGFVSEFNTTTMSSIDILTNQGDAVHKGLEVEMEYNLARDLYIALNMGYLDAKLTKSNALTSNLMGELVSVKGRRAYAPRFSGNATIGYSRMLANSSYLNTTLSYNYRSNFSGHLTSPADQAVLNLDGYGVFNFRAELEPRDSDWSVSVWVKNLTDKQYLTRVKNDGLRSYMDIFGEPRAIGVALGLNW